MVNYRVLFEESSSFFKSIIFHLWVCLEIYVLDLLYLRLHILSMYAAAGEY